MKGMSLAGLMLVAMCGFSPQAVHAETKAFAASPDQGRQAWFPDMLKTVADANGTNESDKVGRILGVKSNKSVATTALSLRALIAMSVESDEYTPASTAWFPAGSPGHAFTGNWQPNGQEPGEESGYFNLPANLSAYLPTYCPYPDKGRGNT